MGGKSMTSGSDSSDYEFSTASVINKAWKGSVG